MKRFLLSFLCLMVAFGLNAEENGRELITDSRHYLVEKNKKWYEFKSDILLFKGSQVLEQTCCQLLGGNGQQSLQEFVKERLSIYNSKRQYSQRNRLGLILVGQDIILVNVKGQIVGDYQNFEISKSLQEEGGETDSKQWNIVYDMKNDNVLTVDDIFVPETATMLKNNANGDFISIYVERKKIFCGLTQTNGTIKYEILNYIENEDILTEQFKQNIDIDELRTEYIRESEEQRKQELQEQHRQDSLQKVREEYLVRTASKRIATEFGELAVNQAFSQTSDTTKTSKTNITAGSHVLNTIKNEDGATDSLWTRELITPQYAGGQRPGVSKRMSYELSKREPMYKNKYGYGKNTYYLSNIKNYESGRWTTYFDIDIPANNPLFEQRLCKLIMNKSSKRLEDAGVKFVHSFKGKWIGWERASIVKIRGRALSYNPGKYYSYACSYTYPGLFSKTNSGKSPQVDWSISKNIIYDIKNNKVLSLSDVLTIEEITNLGLKKKTKADLALDNYNFYVGIGGKLVCTYALSRENWNKFTSVLQDLIAPYDSLPAKIDSTAFDFKDYEGIQPASISYKVNQEPSFRGHADSLLVYLKSHLALPDTMKSEHSWELQFVVGKDGHVSQVETKADKKGDGDEFFASKLTEAFEQMPAWQPLELAGLGVQNTLLSYNVKFVLHPTPEKDCIYEIVEEYAQFPGGNEACVKWIAEHVKYPAICKLQGVQGRIFVSFVVNEDGSISDVKTLGSPDPNLSEEAELVVKMMPKWIPGKLAGQPARSRFILPIVFGLGD